MGIFGGFSSGFFWCNFSKIMEEVIESLSFMGNLAQLNCPKGLLGG